MQIVNRTPSFSLLDLFHAVKRRSIHITVRAGQADPPGNTGHGSRVVSGNHFKIHSLLHKITQGLLRIFPDRIADKKQGNRLQPSWKLLAAEPFPACRKHQHPLSLRGRLVNLAAEGLQPFLQHKLFCSHHISAVSRKFNAAPFSGRRKRNHRSWFPPRRFRAELPHSLGRRVMVRQRSHNGGNRISGFLLRMACQGMQAIHLHVPGGDGSGLIQTEHIHPRQSLDGVELLNQRIFPSQTDHADRQHHAGQQYQTFRDHADQSRHRADNGFFLGHRPEENLFAKQGDAHRDNRKSDHLDDFIDTVHNLRVGPLQIFGVPADLGRIVFFSDMDYLGPCGSGNHKASGKNRVPRGL